MLKSMINPDSSGKKTNLVFGFMLIMLLAMSSISYAQNYALDFDGSNDYVEVSSSESLNFGTGDFTISLWVNSTLTSDGILIEKILDASSTSGGNGWAIALLSTGRYRFYITDTQEGNPTNFNSTSASNRDGKWHHLAIAVDRDSNVSFYIDGKLDDVETGVTDETGSLSNDYPLLIGINYNKNATKDMPFNGLIDEVRIWNTVRTQAQIQEYMCETLTGSESGLVAYYRMTDGSGTSLTDNSTNSNTGTLHNMDNSDWVNDNQIPNGDGSSTPYQINGLNQLYWLSQNSSYWSDDFDQVTDIDASATSSWDSGNGFSPIGKNSYRFTGTYNGDGHTIDALFINRPTTDYIGLFGFTNGATIENLGVTNVDITGQNNVGGLVGRNHNATISNSYSTGSVSGNIRVGGLVGDNFSSATISNCYSTGSISGSSYVGGLVGVNTAAVTDCFWDIQTSGQDNSAGGTGKTTAEMTTDAHSYPNFYTDAGWDFKGVGAEGIWNIGNGKNDGYPYLDWQYPGDPATLPVTLSTFTAQFLNNTPTLYWTTQSETDNMGWFVYRNVENDFTTSEKISEFIEGHGTTTQQQSYIYEDNIENPKVGDTYYYWLESIDYSGIINHYDKVAQLIIPEIYDPGGGLVPVPEIYGLLQNEPNPFIESTKISFNLHKTAQVELNIYNLKGQLVKSLYSGMTSSQSLAWDGSDAAGQKLSAGVYLYKMIVNGKTEDVKKLILMR